MEYAAPDSPKEHVAHACEQVGLIGGELRGLLSSEIASKVLLRQGRDVVLLTGQTGTGKEKVAGVVHEAARRALGRKGELIEVNCANLSGSLFEGELFGHKRGAFTGADREHGGLVARAQGGTLVLDEIQSLEPQNQARLLRFLGEREYRAVGDERVQRTDALIVLSTNKILKDMVRDGSFRRDLLDRAPAKINVPSLYERRQDIGELAQAFALEAGRDAGAVEFYGLTRRAKADLETAIIRASEVSVRRLREIVRDAVFTAAADLLPEALDSELLLPLLERELSFSVDQRDAQDALEVEREFELLVGATRLQQLAESHEISKRSLSTMCRALKAVIDELPEGRRSYRNVVERSGRLAKLALWLVSGATTQAEFRKFFGATEFEMPTKSVAHQLYHEVFPEGPLKKAGEA